MYFFLITNIQGSAKVLTLIFSKSYTRKTKPCKLLYGTKVYFFVVALEGACLEALTVQYSMVKGSLTKDN